jgi:hypothetical protein
VGQSYKDLIVWQKAMDFVAAIYSATKRFPQEADSLLKSSAEVGRVLNGLLAQFDAMQFLRQLNWPLTTGH